jgi:hypothetical protein
MGTTEQKDVLTELLKIIGDAIQHSNSRLRLAKSEQDNSTKSEPEAGHFLKLDEKRLGRDIALYSFMGNEVIGWERTLLMMFEEILIPLRLAVPESYKAASKPFCELGEFVYPEKFVEEWRHLFD